MDWNRLGLAAAVLAAGCALEAKTVRVSDFGFDPADATAFIRRAIESDADEIVLDRASGPWYADALAFVEISNKVIRLEKGVELRAKRGAFHGISGTNACLMSFVRCSDIALIGPGAAFRMERDVYAAAPYARSEHRHCLNLRGVRNFRVEGLTFAESGGDGIFVGGSWREKRFVNSENVAFTDVVCDRNYRQGLSIICVSNFVAKGCVFSNTKGTPPQSGVDIEPNQACEFLSRIVFRDCRFENNAGRGLEFYIGNLNSESPPVTALLDRCRMIGNVNGFEYQQNRARYSDLPRGGRVILRDCAIERSTHAGICIIDKPASSAQLVFRNVSLVDCCTRATNAPDVSVSARLVDTPPTDGIVFEDVKIARAQKRPWISPGAVDYTSTGVRATSGSVDVTTAGRTVRIVLDDAWRTAAVPLPEDGPTRPRVVGAFDGKAQVADPAPGEMRPLENVVLAGTHRIVVFVDRARTAKFRVKHVKLSGKRPITLDRIYVRTESGDRLKTLRVADATDEQELAFAVKRAGFYTLEVSAGKQGFAFLASDVPMATEIREKPVRFGLTRAGSPLRFFAERPFSLFAGADGYEKGNVRLLDPSGVEVWAHPLLADWRRYQGAGAPGLWTLDVRCPKARNKTVGVDLSGVAGFLFLSKERHWKCVRCSP